MSRWVQLVFQFFKLIVERFIRNQGMPNAASLTFASLLSIVPLMTVSLAIGSAFSISDKISIQVRTFLFENFVPASGEVLEQHISQFIDKASSLTGTGFLFLLVVALMVMASIDRAFNMIWQVKHRRKPLRQFVVYWAVLTLGPLLIGVSVAVSSYIISLPLLAEVASEVESASRVLSLTPFVASAVAFCMLYLLVPNAPVSVKHAILGGLFSALLFEFAKRGFAFYITQFPTYAAIYGGLAAIPVFLIWVYLSWVITLLGAEFTYGLGSFSDRGTQDALPHDTQFVGLFRLLRLFWIRHQAGETVSHELLEQHFDVHSDRVIADELERLEGARLIVRSEAQDWVLCRDLGSFSVGELVNLAGAGATIQQWPEEVDEGEAQLRTLLINTQNLTNRELSVPLSRFFVYRPL